MILEMMNPFIEEQLNKVLVPIEKVGENKFLIRRSAETQITDFEVGHYYIIEVEDYIIHPYNGFTLHENWNGGVVPTDRRMQVEVVRVMGKMIKVNALGLTDGKIWCGWIPQKSAKIMQVIL